MPEIKKQTQKEKRKHLSFSSLNTYLLCPLKYCFKYVEKKDAEETSVHLVLGKVLHKIYAQTLTMLNPAGVDPINIFDMESLFEIEFRKLAQDHNIQYEGKTEKQYLEDGKIYTRVLVNYLVKTKKNSGNQVFIDYPFVVPLIFHEKVFELPLKGILDYFVVDKKNKKILTVKFKTSSRKYAPWQLNRNFQILCYMYAIKQMLGEEYEILFQFEILLKNKNPEILKYEKKYSKQEMDYFLSVIDQISKGIESNSFYPRPNFLCSHCEYAEACKAWP